MDTWQVAGFLFSNIVVGVAVYYFTRYYDKTRLRKRAAMCIDAVNCVRDGRPIPSELQDTIIAPVYETLRNLASYIETQEKNRAEMLTMINSLAINISDVESLMRTMLPKLLDITKSEWSAFYLANNASQKLELKASIGFSSDMYKDFDMNIGEGFIGRVAVTKQMKVINDLPQDTIFCVKTFLGRIIPNSLVIAPIIYNEELLGVLVLGSVSNFSQKQLEFLELIKVYVGALVFNGIAYENKMRLVSQLELQSRQMNDLHDELEKQLTEQTRFLVMVFNSIKEYAIYSTNKDYSVLGWNDGAEAMFGYSLQDICGKHVGLIYSVEEIESGMLREKMEMLKTVGRYENRCWIKRSDGTSVLINELSFPMYNQVNDFVGVVSVSRIIKNEKQH
ncbi:MAG: GAF domain-containing protein [Clostridiales bacterium]|jgi:PAS domain S-box-containing protein|nr:GAF domain-containing protein [Clostridiales bacterium]